ncbi:MAG: hypothetical protein APF77_08085 [Clostridia bacterium BRH_c25]|nr:MAG: hypothetical protein APF77_08085 [Clostridia bacterium BRH_c25]
MVIRFSPPHTPPLYIYQPKKKYLCLSAGNTTNFIQKGAFMKQSDNKKNPKVFRTLIRRIHIGSKVTKNDMNRQCPGKKNEKQEGQS